MSESPEEEEGHCDFGPDHHDDAMEMAVDKNFYSFTPNHHSASYESEPDESSKQHATDERKDA